MHCHMNVKEMFFLSLSSYAVLIFRLHVTSSASLILNFIAILSLASCHFFCLNSKYECFPEARFSPNRIVFFAQDIVIRAHKDSEVRVNYVKVMDAKVWIMDNSTCT
jgi:hypothetical protein